MHTIGLAQSVGWGVLMGDSAGRADAISRRRSSGACSRRNLRSSSSRIIEVTLNGGESQAYARVMKDGNYQLIHHSWTTDFNDPINFLNLYVSGSSFNYDHHEG